MGIPVRLGCCFFKPLLATDRAAEVDSAGHCLFEVKGLGCRVEGLEDVLRSPIFDFAVCVPPDMMQVAVFVVATMSAVIYG